MFSFGGISRFDEFWVCFKVNWYPWGEEAFAEAQKRNVPIFLSSIFNSSLQVKVVLVDS